MGECEQAGLLPRDPAVAVRDGGREPRRRRADRGRPGRDREALRPRPRLGPGAQRASCSEVLDESQILRIDHFLGKEPVMDILYLRFANTMLEPVWNRRYVDSRADHDGRGLRGRGPRQLLRPGRRAARRRPEPPAADAGAGRDGAAVGGHRRRRLDPRPASSTCSGRCPSADPSRFVRGQYEGYLEVDGVAPGLRRPRPSSPCGSRSRTGAGPGCRSSSAPASRMPVEATEVRVVFKRPPRLGIGGRDRSPTRTS